MTISVRHLKEHEGETVTVRGWLANKRSSGKIALPAGARRQRRRAGGGSAAPTSREEAWEDVERVTQESTVRVTGIGQVGRARAGRGRDPGRPTSRSTQPDRGLPDHPKEHGVDFLMEHRHLWLRSSRQRAVLRVRSEVVPGDPRLLLRARLRPASTRRSSRPAACEGTSTLFETDYFGDKAYLSQSGQLYLEPACAAFGKVYCFGPDLPRREVEDPAPPDRVLDGRARGGLPRLRRPPASWPRSSSCYVVGRVLERCREELEGPRARHRRSSRRSTPPFPAHHLRRGGRDPAAARASRHRAGATTSAADDETLLAEQFDRPVMVTHFPAEIKAFYMQPDPDDPEVALCVDVLAPEGYGEIIGGSQRDPRPRPAARAHRASTSCRVEAFQWYLDMRKYGTLPALRLRHGHRALRRLDLRARATCARPSPTRGCSTRSTPDRPARRPPRSDTCGRRDSRGGTSVYTEHRPSAAAHSAS